MSAVILGATIRRILTQLRHDRRTIGMIVGIPVVLIALIYFMFDGRQPLTSMLMAIMLGVFPFVLMFVITSVAMLRERTSGTLERIMTTPTGKLDLLAGYGISFGIVAALQGIVASACAYWLFGLTTAGSAYLVITVAIVNALLGVGMGLLSSAFARTEFQAVQMMPIITFPQVMLCGLFVPRADMTGWLQVISDVMPMSYAVEAMQEVVDNAAVTSVLLRDLGIVAGCVVLALALAAATLRRRTA